MGEASDRYVDYASFSEVFDLHVAPQKRAFFDGMGGPVVMGDRGGVFFEDRYTKKRYLNCHVNGGVYNLGHNNPAVIAAVRDALGTLDVGNHHLPSVARAELARRLSATTDHKLSRVVFAAGGGEAADLAIKAVRARTGRRTIISASGGYHGHTGLALATGDGKFRDLFGPNLPGFEQVPYDNIDALQAAVNDDTAAVILESLPATLGMVIPSPGYVAAVRALCDERGAKLIMDEIQSGLGRTGTMWSYQQDGITPDAILTGKGLSGGIYPIAATLMTRDLHGPLENHPFVHLSSFGGAELGCAAATSVLDQVEAPGFMARVTQLSQRFADEFADLPFTLRRRGMFMGMKFPDAATSLGRYAKLLQEGVFGFPSGNDVSVLQFLPPLVISDEETEDLIGRVKRATA